MESIINVESSEDWKNAVGCILEDIASKVLDVRIMLRNKCPWASYISNKTGGVWSTFIARHKFKGYHLKFYTDRVICTNLDNGKQYVVDLNSCACKFFHACQSPPALGIPCTHMALLQQKVASMAKSFFWHLHQREVALAAVFTVNALAVPEFKIEHPLVGIEPAECPEGVWLEKIKNSSVLECEVFYGLETSSGFSIHKLGRLSETETLDEILACTPGSFRNRQFANTSDAIRFLAKYAGIKIPSSAFSV